MSTKTGPVLGYQMVKRVAIRPSPTNPRKFFDPEKMRKFADNLRLVGILQPLVVRWVHRFTLHEPDLIDKVNWRLLDAAGKEVFKGSEKDCRAKAGKDGLEGFYELVAGERRWRGAELASLDLVPAIVRQLTDEEALELQQIENLQREDLTAIEEAEGFDVMIKSGLYTVEKLMAKLSVSRSHIFGRLKLLKLSKPVREALREGKVEASLAGLIAQIPDPARQAQALKDAVEGPTQYDKGPMSFRDFQEHLQRRYMVNLKNAPFGLADASVCPKAGACTACLKRTGNMKELFPDIGSPDVCTDTNCFGEKREAHINAKLAAAEAKGQRILGKKEYEKVRYTSEYVDLDGNGTYVGDSYKKWREILKGSEVKPIVARDDDKLVEILPRAQAMEAAKKLGVKIKESASSGYDQERKEESKARKRNKLARNKAIILANGKLFEGLQKLSGVKLWRFIVDCLARSCTWEQSPRVLEFLGITASDKADRHTLVEETVTKLKNEADMRQAALGILIAADAVGQWSAEFGENITEAAELCGVDLEKIAKDCLPQDKAKTAKPAKGASALPKTPNGKAKKKK